MLTSRVRGIALILTAAAIVHAAEQPAENPAAAQFRQHLAAADRDKDGFVTREELIAEIKRSAPRDPSRIEQTVDAMMQELDTDHDGRLSKAEVADGARKTGQKAATRLNVERAQLVMEALASYQQKHPGARPAKLEALEKLHLVVGASLRCVLADGREKPWGYAGHEQPAGDPNAVILFSPGAVDAQGQYVVGLGDGRVLGLQDKELDLGRMPKLKMHVYPDR